MQQYTVNKYSMGVNSYGLRPCDAIYTATLPTDSAITVTVPTQLAQGTIGGQSLINPRTNQVTTSPSWYNVVIDCSAETWFSVNGTAVAPVGNTFALAAAERISPNVYFCRTVRGGDVLSFLSVPASTNACVRFYQIQQD